MRLNYFVTRDAIYPFKLADKYSRFIRAMFSSEIPFGHSTSQAPVLVQFPKPSASICLTIFKTRSVASTLPCGNNAYCETFAATNNMADEFLQVATQAPQQKQVEQKQQHSITVPMPTRLPPVAYNHFSNKAVFKVKASLAADNYQLYTNDDQFYETAMIPTYKCSVMMNALFRTIKENANLDLLEESDDDEEFENTQMDKFVDLEKIVLMECVYSKRFKKWQPNKTVPPHSAAATLKDLPKI